MPNLPELYTVLLAEVKARIRSAQYAALRAVNQELIHDPSDEHSERQLDRPF